MQAASFEVRVLRASGKQLGGIYESTGSYLAIDTGRWLAGTYILEILVDGKTVDSRKVIISK